jgi:nucleotidyltransferase/DNA polymerase involved in DNA repair
VCRLPLLGDGEEEAGSLDGIERLSEKCSKCGMERVSVSDFLEFGIDVNSVVQQIRFEVEQATGLTCSAGIAISRDNRPIKVIL